MCVRKGERVRVCELVYVCSVCVCVCVCEKERVGVCELAYVYRVVIRYVIIFHIPCGDMNQSMSDETHWRIILIGY